MKQFYLILLLATGLVILWLLSNRFEMFSSDPVFLSREETAKLLSRDPGSYVANMSDPDLKARGATTRQEYLQKCIQNAADFTHKEKKHISKLTRSIDKKVKKYQGKLLIDIDTKVLKDIEWKFAKTNGSVCENGFPHTRADVIFVSSETLKLDSKSLGQTLLHEKVHIYQRLYPELVSRDIERAGYRKLALRKTFPLSRANCDLDEWVYIKDGEKPLLIEYRSESPVSIKDHDGVSKNEHPYETMAYDLEKIV